jgi:hypothetical protein
LPGESVGEGFFAPPGYGYARPPIGLKKPSSIFFKNEYREHAF